MNDANPLNQIVEDLISMIEKSREKISDLGEKNAGERERIVSELDDIKKKLQDMDAMLEQMKFQERQVRLNLQEISNNKDSSNEDFLEAYERAGELQQNMGLMLEREKHLKTRKDQLYTLLKKIDDAMEQAEKMFPRVGIALDYLLGKLLASEKKVGEASQRQALGLKIILAQEEERRRVAREIHDGPAQSMANLVLRTEICEKIIDSKPQEVKDELRELKTMVRNSLQEIRKIIFDLRPMALDDLGLIATLKRFMEDFRDKNSINIDFTSSGVMVEGNKDLEIAVFRIVQEALNNVVKHADAGDVMVSVSFERSYINVSVRDNGRGFNPEKKLPDGSYGLMGIKERIDLLEGILKINSAVGKGTELSVKIPVKAEKQ